MEVEEAPRLREPVKRKAEETNVDDMRAKKQAADTATTTNKMHNNNTQAVVKYSATDTGPFVIMFRGHQDNPVNEHMIVKQLKEAKIEFRKILRITRSSKQVVKVVAEDAKWANKIAEVAMKDVEVYIPTENVFRQIIVFNLPDFLTLKEIKEDVEITGASEIIDVERINRWNFEKQAEEPTTQVKITYRGNTIPKEVFVCRVLQSCAVYVKKPLFCKSCYSFGHLKKWCKKPNTCKNCLEEHEIDQLCQTRHCRYCKEDHKTGNRECQETKRQWTIAKIVATDRCTRKEAVEKLMQHNGGFPNLGSPERGVKSVNNRINEWQDPESLANQLQRGVIQEKIICQLKEETKNMENFFSLLIQRMKKRNPKEQQFWTEVNDEFNRVRRSKVINDQSKDSTN